MTATQLQDMARKLANSSWCRYWLNWSGSHNPIMAIQCIGGDGKPERISDAASYGLTEHDDCIYTAPRTNEDGTPYESQLF